MSAGTETSVSKKGQHRVQWGVHETWVLLAIWEDRLEDLRRAKRNFGVYADMATKLAEAGFKKTVEQVHHKIENLSNTYR
ncbi:hypothetical protein HPB47_008355 [Ixodes persulcatus]|uniref:Uncharacterized protein n=1 Tax=Ixodes persulcatus TaxID=34615 RepID=A0AC60P4X2_IXOPE|nr:hypothetical protein HPB47_008355 [Ixodes persulcatus]